MRWLLLLSAASAPVAVTSASAAKHDVAAYIADGFRIAAKQEEERVLPGKAPYADHNRVVLVTKYQLERGAESVICEVSYDSQQDTITTVCE